MVKTEFTGKPMRIISLSLILILKASLKVRGKSISNKRKFLFRLKGVSVTRNINAFQRSEQWGKFTL